MNGFNFGFMPNRQEIQKFSQVPFNAERIKQCVQNAPPGFIDQMQQFAKMAGVSDSEIKQGMQYLQTLINN